MNYIKGVTFGFMTGNGAYADKKSKESLLLLKKNTACDTVILALGAMQKNAHTETVEFTGPHMPSDGELCEMIALTRELGLKVILKPLVNCKDGTWRAHINFFDHEVPCEPKWSKWFESYTAYQLHYAELAQKTGCDMLMIGCEMVQAQRKEDHWRALVEKVRGAYGGMLTYNTDKYQEEHVAWWDALDVISSSGYYPINDWSRQLDRIEAVVKRVGKPFFFAEAGCPSTKGSSLIPNDWTWQAELALNEQERYYRVMFEECAKRKFVQGFGLWDWHSHLYEPEQALLDRGYAVYLKPAQKAIFDFYSSF
ncbi:MAG: 1,4-beta-xylanase [Acetanaerobacterium sp.]